MPTVVMHKQLEVKACPKCPSTDRNSEEEELRSPKGPGGGPGTTNYKAHEARKPALCRGSMKRGQRGRPPTFLEISLCCSEGRHGHHHSQCSPFNHTSTMTGAPHPGPEQRGHEQGALASGRQAETPACAGSPASHDTLRPCFPGCLPPLLAHPTTPSPPTQGLVTEGRPSAHRPHEHVTTQNSAQEVPGLAVSPQLCKSDREGPGSCRTPHAGHGTPAPIWPNRAAGRRRTGRAHTPAGWAGQAPLGL